MIFEETGVNENPLVSVLMTSFNREKYIAEAIESVLASSYKNFELIIVDDASTDRTVEIANKYLQKDNRIRMYINEVNLGQFPNRNRTADYAQGSFIIFVDSDDKILKDGVSQLVNVMVNNPESGFGMKFKDFDEVVVLDGRDALRRHFFERPFLIHGPGATILRRDFFLGIDKYPVDYGIPGDMFFNLKACCYTSITLIPFEFMFYRVHGDQELSNSYDYLYNNYKYLNEALKLLPLGLNVNELAWLTNKNKRRFSCNIIRFLFTTFNLKKTFKAIRLANFSLKDFAIGVFYFREKPKLTHW